MAMTLRADKGAILSWNEMDANFRACLGVHNLLHVQDQKAMGTHGGTFTTGAWRTRPLNTVRENTISGASLNSNRITLPIGNYFLSGFSISYATSSNQSRIQRITPTSETLIEGASRYTWNSTYVENVSNISGAFTLSAISDIELQHICYVTGTFGMSAYTGQTANNLFAQLLIWKLA